MRTAARTLLLVMMTVHLLGISTFAVGAQESTPPAADSSTVAIAIRPHDKTDGQRFEATAEPGQVVEFIAVIENFGKESLALRTYISDLVPTPNGGLNIALPDAERTGPAGWTDFETEEITLEPNQSVERPFTVTVPEGTPSGQHVAGVVLETVDPLNAANPSSAFMQYFRKVISMYITVPGDMQAEFTMGEPTIYVEAGMATLVIPISNTGNVRIDVVGSVQLLDESGESRASSDIRLGPIYAGQETVIALRIPAAPPAGEYTIDYSLTDSASEFNVSADSVAVQVPEDELTTAQRPIKFLNVRVEPNADPILYADLSVDVELLQQSYGSTRLTLIVMHNGEFVEDFVLGENLTLAIGSTTVTQRYLPNTGWESGTYTFSLRLESIEGGQSTLLFEVEDVATLEVP